MTAIAQPIKPKKATWFMAGILPIDSSRISIDIVAGITLAALAIPEVMGYTKIAGMPVVTGLYTILIPTALFALFGSSRLLVVGAKGWHYGDTFELLQRHIDSVQFLGYVSDHELQRLYRKAKGLIYPSFYEGFGLPVLEAMASGCPVVTSDRSSLPEIGGDAVLYVNPDNVLQIAAVMEKLLMDDSLRRTLAKRGLARASRFSWERCAQETVAVYEKILNR